MQLDNNSIHQAELTPEMTLVEFDKPSNMTYKPGQYAVISTGETKGYFSYFSHESQDQVQFLIKRGNETADAILSAESLELSEPRGSGFNLEKAKQHNLLLLTHGSGISAIRPVIIEALSNRDSYEDIILIYGIKNENHLPLSAEFKKYAESIQVIYAYSEKDGKNGHTQKHVARLDESFVKNAACCIVGSKEMSSACKEVLESKGISPELVLTNF